MLRAEVQTLRDRVRVLERAASEASEAATTLLAVLSHELRSPVHALSLNLELSLERLRSGDAVPRVWLTDRMERQRRNVAQLRRLIDTFLEVAQLSTGRLPMHAEPVDLREVVTDVVRRSADELAWAGCALEVHAPEPVNGTWDRVQLDLVLSNLLSNAAKYGAGHPVRVEATAASGAATLRVRDGGPGIAPEHQARVFEKFARLPSTSSVAGFGLGLWIVREVVTAMGGTVAVDSAPGQGATFTVRLPA